MSAGTPILIVDDNPLNLKLTRLLLAQAGYVAECAADAEQALEILKTFSPRLILMDLQLPGMNGFQLTEILKRDPARRDVIIVALTAYAMKGDEQRAIDAGCDAYVAKPIDTRTLTDRVAQLLAEKRRA
jgi:two-component system cell cycle response regulator DivK